MARTSVVSVVEMALMVVYNTDKKLLVHYDVTTVIARRDHWYLGYRF